MAKNALWISPICPGQTFHGNVSYQGTIIDMLVSCGCCIDLIYYGTAKTPSAHAMPLRKLWQIKDERKERDCEYMYIDEWVSDVLMEFARDKGAQRNYDLLIVDYVWMSRLLTIDTLRGAKKIIIGHDIFSGRAEVFRKIGMKPRWFYTSRDEEAKGLQRADIILAITDEDLVAYKNLAPNIKSLVWADFDILAIPRAIAKNHLKIGYIASDNIINKYSARLFFEKLNILARSRKDSPQFLIAGKICDNLGVYPNLNISRLGFVNDKAKYYENCDLMIIPTCDSTGLKIKSLEALAYGKPFISTRDASAGFSAENRWHLFENVSVMANCFAEIFLTGKLNDLLPELLAETKRMAALFYVKSHLGRKLFVNELFGENSGKRSYVSVSVIISVYNCGDTIACCLDSIFNDRLENKEVIVIDDCSDDATPQILAKYADKIHLITNRKNIGQGLSRNRGLDAANGEYVYIVDGDDEIGPDAIYYLYNQAIKDHLDVCLINRPQLKSLPVEHLGVYACWGCLIARRLIIAHELRQPDLRSGQDGIFFHMALVYSRRTGFCEEATYLYCKNPEGTFAKMAKDFKNLPLILEQQLSIMRGYYADLKIKPERFLMYLYQETYKARFKTTFSVIETEHSRKIYYMIKELLIFLKDKIGTKMDHYFDVPFKNIPFMDYEQWQEKYYPAHVN